MVCKQTDISDCTRIFHLHDCIRREVLYVLFSLKRTKDGRYPTVLNLLSQFDLANR